jgi:hypothetical protein
MRLRLLTPSWGRLPAFAVVLVCALSAPALAQGKKKKPPVPPPPPTEKVEASDDTKPDKPKNEAAAPAKKGPVKEQNFNFEGLGLNGRSRSPQLLYFLERANEELERASLQKRSFIPHMVRSLEEEKL